MHRIDFICILGIIGRCWGFNWPSIIPVHILSIDFSKIWWRNWTEVSIIFIMILWTSSQGPNHRKPLGNSFPSPGPNDDDDYTRCSNHLDDDDLDTITGARATNGGLPTWRSSNDNGRLKGDSCLLQCGLGAWCRAWRMRQGALLNGISLSCHRTADSRAVFAVLSTVEHWRS